MSQNFDAIVVGAGFAGMAMIQKLQNDNFSVQGFERGDDVGGTWYWNRYPGCRCDVESLEYSYQFDEALQQEWRWSERYASQPEILDYARHVADRYKLRDHIQFGTTVAAATWQAAQGHWHITTDRGDTFTSQFLIMAVGCLSATNTPKIEGLESFAGKHYHTGAWPHDGVDMQSKRVAVIGTGSSGIQSIPLIAQQAAQLTVFQRTPNYSLPARNAPLSDAEDQAIKQDYAAFRAKGQLEQAAQGAKYPTQKDSALKATQEERQARFESYWQLGGFAFGKSFGDLSTNEDANEIAANFVRNKIRSIVKDPATAEKLMPRGKLGCKRLCVDTDYYETYNRENVELVDINTHPIERITPHGLITQGREYKADIIVFATGYDAMTGSILKCDITGRDGLSLKEKWADGPKTYLGLSVAGFPNLFNMTGPGSPSVLANMITGAEQHADFIGDMMVWMRSQGHRTAETTTAHENAWAGRVNARADITFYPTCNSWYLGANVPGKPRVFMPYVGYPDYVKQTTHVAENGYVGFELA
ncbi:MAG: flavin-containing monooxygenase [Alphaproteobacteria bacterium]